MFVNADFDGDVTDGFSQITSFISKREQPRNHFGTASTALISSNNAALPLTEYTRRRELLLAKYEEKPFFSVQHNWRDALKNNIKEVKDTEIVLPFPSCNFNFLYLDEHSLFNVEQDTDTLSISVMVLRSNTTLTADEIAMYKEHILYTCLALEIEIADKVLNNPKDLGKESIQTKPKGDVYKVLALQKKKTKSATNTNTGRHGQRFHIRRSHFKTIKGIKRRIKWYYAGNIELGIIIKDYLIK